MRADRLLSLLMLLQTRGRMTAQDLASELEVSGRTIYRDLVALSASGVPVFAERGPGGGLSLIEEYRTSLTGLTPEEVRALFMMNVPAPLAQLGVGPQFKQALLKLSASLPDSRRLDEARSRQRIHLDSSWWFQGGQAHPCLGILQQALWQDCRLRLKIRQEFFDTEFEQVIDPYGLVAKANVWYLIYARKGSLHVLRIQEIAAAEMLPDTFVYPNDFDLAEFWEKWCREYESRPAFIARVRLSPEALSRLPHYMEEHVYRSLDLTALPDPEGWVVLDLPFENLIVARTRLLGLGRAVEVLEPQALRNSLIDYAGQVVDFYKEKEIRDQEKKTAVP